MVSRSSELINLAARIDKLSILGIRSFDQKRSETIQFHTPLTLIVGYNGSGKTTIIECLKYVTTGLLPPNSKNGAFIHDPKICGEKEVQGQVKLSFRASTGHQVVITRSMQVTVKKNTVHFKTLEGTILTKTKEGERTSVSSRVAEMDTIMPQYLGVSKAILDSVIFCHQDESLWPLSEPAALKKKFDEIFEAQKYTKAIDNLKALRKTKNVDLTRLREAEVYSKNMKNLGDKAEKQSTELDTEIDQLKVEMKELDKKKREAKEKRQDAFDRETQFKRVISELETHRERERWAQAKVTDLDSSIKPLTESDEWLQSELDRQQERIVSHGEKEKRLTKSYQDMERSIKKIEEKLSQNHTDAGKYEEQQASHEQRVEGRKALIKESSRRHQIRGYDTDLDDVMVNEYSEKIHKLSKTQRAAVEKARREFQRDTDEASDVLNKLRIQRTGLVGKKDSTKVNFDANQSKFKSIQAKLNAIDIDEGGKAILQENIEDLEARLRKAGNDSRKASWDKRTSEGDSQLDRLREKRQEVNRDFMQANTQAGEQARLALLKDEVSERRRNLDTMKRVHNDKLMALVGQNWEPSRLEVDFQTVINEFHRQVKEAERNRDLASHGLEQTEYKLGNAKSDLRKTDNELANCTRVMTEKVGAEPDDYDRALSDIQQERDILKADYNNFGNLSTFYSKAIKKAQGGKHICSLCERTLHESEQEEFVKKMQKKLKNDDADKVKQELDEREIDLRKAKEAGPSYDTWVRLSTGEKPRLQELVKRLAAEREKALLDVESHDNIVTTREDAVRDAESLSKPVAQISRYHQEMTNFSKQSEELTAKGVNFGTTGTPEELAEQLKQVDEKIQGVYGNLKKLRADKEQANSLIATLKLDLSGATNSLSSANYELEKRLNYSKEIDDIKEANQVLQDTIKYLDEKLLELTPQLTAQEKKIEEIRERGKAKVDSVQKELSGLEDSVRKLEFAEETISNYLENNGPARLAKCRIEIDSTEQAMSEQKDEQRQVTVTINKVRQELSNQGQIERNIADNLKYRQAQRDLEEIKSEIAKLSAQNAEADQRHWEKQVKHWDRRYNEASSESIDKHGQATAKDLQLAKLVQEWEVDFKDAAQNYKKAHIDVETTKAAVEDLGRYASALDKAIMHYHGMKMQEINRIIEELWRKTYQGTDVDTILIRSDTEAAKGNRSYNYRVCMVKQDAEMDMRGRCSAGQKVLVSIIIRLALAECFGVNCGLIALDEPTTNLDRDNIQALAGSLHDIIEARRHQANFQLIVITHDEEFLKFMKCPDFCDNYFRVTRNDRQKSQIEKQSITEVM